MSGYKRRNKKVLEQSWTRVTFSGPDPCSSLLRHRLKTGSDGAEVLPHGSSFQKLCSPQNISLQIVSICQASNEH